MERLASSTSPHSFRRGWAALRGLALLCAAATMPAQMAPPHVWNDSATGLLWARDNDQPFVDWWSARSFCEALTVERTGWRQPTLNELIGVWQGSRFKPGFVFNAGQTPVWTSETQGTEVKVFIPRPAGAILGTLRRTEPNGYQSDRQDGIGLCVRERRFWEVAR